MRLTGGIYGVRREGEADREIDDETNVGMDRFIQAAAALNSDDENWQRCVTLFTFNGSLYFRKIKVHNAADMYVLRQQKQKLLFPLYTV